MGIRFACHTCGKRLNIKQELAGKRGVCPDCSTRFRIPLRDSETSIPIEDAPESAVAVSAIPSTSDAVAAEQIVEAESATQPAVPASPATTAVPVGAIDILKIDPDATWYVRPPGGGQYGPADGEVLRSWIGEGRVAATALVWRDGWPQWRQADEAIPELAASMPAGGYVAERTLDAPSDAPPTSPSFDSGPSEASSEVALVTDSAAPMLRGSTKIGGTKSARNNQRVAVITGMSIVCVLLVSVLAYAIFR